jgi:hypothetical protein
MKILLDECLPAPLAKLLSEHDCATVADRGWTGIKNGRLLALADSQFDVFLTADQIIRFQQNLSGFRIAVVELSTNDLRRIRANLDLVRTALGSCVQTAITRVVIP